MYTKICGDWECDEQKRMHGVGSTEGQPKNMGEGAKKSRLKISGGSNKPGSRFL